MKNSLRNSIIYRIAFSFSLMSLLTLLLLSGISYIFLSSQYTKNIKTSLINQFQTLQDEIISDKSKSSLEEQLPTLTNEWYIVSIRTGSSYTYHEQTIPFIDKWFYMRWWKDSDTKDTILFYTASIKWDNIFLGKKMDDFEKTKTGYITTLIIINSLFIVILILLSLILSKKILKPITKLSNYLLWYRFDNKESEQLYQEGQPFEISILTKAFDTAIHYTQQSLQKEKEFLQDASHELRTPLMWISSSIELLQTENLTLPQQQKIDVIQLLSSKLKRITNELLFLTRWEINANLDENIYIWKEIQVIIDGYEELLKQKNINLISNLDTTYIIHASQIHVQKVFSNLIDNAIKYTPNWWTITIVLQDGMFSIQDTGIGMSKSFITRIGERFIREDKATKVNYEGVGLGLSIVYKIAQIYGWKIDITSEQEKGTMIKVCFTDKTDKER